MTFPYDPSPESLWIVGQKRDRETQTATASSGTGSSFRKREIPAAFGEVELSEKFGAGRSFGMN